MKRLNQIMPPVLNNTFTIFTILDDFEVPWAEMDISEELYIDYMCNISGNKIISNLLENFVAGDEITEAELLVVMRLIYSMYGEKWLRIWQVLISEYNPIHNYNMTETMTDDETEFVHGKTTTRTNALTMTKEGTETETPNNLTEEVTRALTRTKEGTETETPTNLTEEVTRALTHTKEGTETTDPGSSKTESNSVYGFNSVDSVPVDNKETTFTGEDTITYDLEEGDNGTVTTVKSGSNEITYDIEEGDNGTVTTVKSGSNEISYDIEEGNNGTITDVDSGTDTQTRNYTLNRSGNIGVTTTQQMIQAEIDLRKLHDFFRSIVYPDLDRVLTIEIY